MDRKSQYNVSEQTHFKRVDEIKKLLSTAYYAIDDVIDLIYEGDTMASIDILEELKETIGSEVD